VGAEAGEPTTVGDAAGVGVSCTGPPADVAGLVERLVETVGVCRSVVEQDVDVHATFCGTVGSEEPQGLSLVAGNRGE
jgi:hypothetical protein